MAAEIALARTINHEGTKGLKADAGVSIYIAFVSS